MSGCVPGGPSSPPSKGTGAATMESRPASGPSGATGGSAGAASETPTTHSTTENAGPSTSG
eukprot:7575724-Alexandrium_andersonii.AAC.1